MEYYRSLQCVPKRDFPVPGGDHFYGSGRKTFSCEININGPQPLLREKFKLRCSLFLPDGTESHGLLDDSAWSWDLAGQHGVSKHDFLSLPATLTFNFKKATGKLIMINISVAEVDSDPLASSCIGSVNTTTFWVKSKRRLSDQPEPKVQTGMKRTYSESSEQSQTYEGSIETVCKWTEIAMNTMNRVKRSRWTEDGDKEILRDAMSQCHILQVYEALDTLRKQVTEYRALGHSESCISPDDEDLHSLLMEFWDDAVAEQQGRDVASRGDSTTTLPPHDTHAPTSAPNIQYNLPDPAPSLRQLKVSQSLQSPPPMMNRIYSEGSSKGRMIHQFLLEKLKQPALR